MPDRPANPTMTHAPESPRGASVGDAATPPLLEVRGLQVTFPGRRRAWWSPRRDLIRAVDGVSFRVEAGQTFALVGESGCGKSTTARAIVNLVRPAAGEVRLRGRLTSRLREGAMRPYRRQVQMVFQDPYASLDPRMTAGAIVEEPLVVFAALSRRERKLEVLRLFELVGLNPSHARRYPHEFSGGQRQRIGIARALALRPELLVCDEPVSALDVSIQAQVVNLLVNLQQRLGLAYVFIAHDLAVVRQMAHRVGVMYLGRLVEEGPADAVYNDPRHPYTRALLSAVPEPDPVVERTRRRIVLTGDVPSPDRAVQGCPFADRCPLVEPRCRAETPPLAGLAGSDDLHRVACLRAAESPSLMP